MISDLDKALIDIKKDYARVRSVGHRRYRDTMNIQLWAVIDDAFDAASVVTYPYVPEAETQDLALVNFRHRIEDYLSEGE